MIKKGSISVYLCLIMCVLLILIYTCIEAIRISCGRAAVSCAVEESLFSLFSNYDRKLYEDYGLLFIDSGFGHEKMIIGALADETAENMDKILEPSAFGSAVTPKKLYGISAAENAVTGYVLASDQNYSEMRKQICSFMKEYLSEKAINKIAAGVFQEAEDAKKYSFKNNNRLLGLLNEYDAITSSDNDEMTDTVYRYDKEDEAAASEYYAEDNIEKSDTEYYSESSFETDEEYKDIVQSAERDKKAQEGLSAIDNSKKLFQLGIYSFAVPKGKNISDESVNKKTLSSSRNLNSGMGILPEEYSDPLEKVFMNEYALDFFSNYSKEDKKSSLKYQTEYIISGKDNDKANLNSVLNKLMLMRQGFNYIHIMTSPQKLSKIHEVSAIISAIILMPQAEEIISQLLKLLWSYSESLSDIKLLLNNEKVPLFKNDSNWNISFESLCTLNTDTDLKKNKNGLDYGGYLRLLLYMTPEKDTVKRTADMIEYNIRQKTNGKNFCIDNCIAFFEIEFNVYIEKDMYVINRRYGYEAL